MLSVHLFGGHHFKLLHVVRQILIPGCVERDGAVAAFEVSKALVVPLRESVHKLCFTLHYHVLDLHDILLDLLVVVKGQAVLRFLTLQSLYQCILFFINDITLLSAGALHLLQFQCLTTSVDFLFLEVHPRKHIFEFKLFGLEVLFVLLESFLELLALLLLEFQEGQLPVRGPRVLDATVRRIPSRLCCRLAVSRHIIPVDPFNWRPCPSSSQTDAKSVASLLVPNAGSGSTVSRPISSHLFTLAMRLRHRRPVCNLRLHLVVQFEKHLEALMHFPNGRDLYPVVRLVAQKKL
mmetsp:Transcript_94798/g.216929  ORF Transcript_94798/g.216929 Transcript_94798/m.216929 type:complete len:293 (+) Transcript_94798:165-1043(+)